MVGSHIQHYCSNQWAHSGHHVDRKHQGVLACNDIKETNNATKDEEHRVVDEEEEFAFRVQAKSA